MLYLFLFSEELCVPPCTWWNGTFQAAAPGEWYVPIPGEWYVLTCDLAVKAVPQQGVDGGLSAHVPVRVSHLALAVPAVLGAQPIRILHPGPSGPKQETDGR